MRLRADARWVEALDQFERFLGLGDGGLAAEIADGVGQRDVQIAVVVEVVDQIFGQGAHGRGGVKKTQLIDQVVMQRAGARGHVLHGVVLPIGFLAERGAARAVGFAVSVGPVVIGAFDFWRFGDFGRGRRVVRSRFGFRSGGFAQVDENRILAEFLVDAFLQRHERQLQDFHRLDHAGRHLEAHVRPHLLGSVETHGPGLPSRNSESSPRSTPSIASPHPPTALGCRASARPDGRLWRRGAAPRRHRRCKKDAIRDYN